MPQQQQQTGAGAQVMDSVPLFVIVLGAAHVLAVVRDLTPRFGVLDLQAGCPEAADPVEDALTAPPRLTFHDVVVKLLSYDFHLVEPICWFVLEKSNAILLKV
ncbi:unnamed protein product [Alopecurus aequalis]